MLIINLLFLTNNQHLSLMYITQLLEKYMNDLELKIKEINSFIQSFLWMDFEIELYTNNQLIIRGYMDFSEQFIIEITFQNVFMVNSLFSWKTDTSKDIFGIIKGDDAIKINLQYYVEKGYYIFSIISEDGIEQLFVAKNLEYRFNK